MRTCKRCNTKMVKGFDLIVENELNGLVVTKGSGWRAKRLEKPKLAICSDCGEISLYIEGLEEVKEMKYK